MTTIYKALAAVMSDVQAVGKKDRNEVQKFDFRGIDAVMNAVGPVLRQHGVIVVPQLVSSEYSTVEIGRNRTVMGHARVVVRYEFFGPEGDSITSTVAAESMDSGDKATAKAMSVAFRTCLLQALCLPTHEQDPDAVSFERSDEQAPRGDDVRADEWGARLREAQSQEEVTVIAAEIRAASISEPVRRALLALHAKATERLGQR